MNRAHSELSVGNGDPQPRSGEFAQLALWMAANLAGMVTAVLLARQVFFEALARKAGRRRRATRPPSRQQSLSMLASAVLGSNRQMIESVLGPPRSASIKDIGVVVHPKMVFRQADTWYYPLPRNGPVAMAINFERDLATKVEFFTAPGA